MTINGLLFSRTDVTTTKATDFQITRAGHFRTSVRTSAPPYLRTTKRGAEVRTSHRAVAQM
ncbi:hypothetical protein E2C01_004798 [Portunus trituberculatus]|uniref:Uncharacterized protein n=1 Tax=Portunus trituberculatus TaxID=210409 RepID=A0A5B7CRP2_PORTR|nr:hypothetical protein [Portunus trituberculatus]